MESNQSYLPVIIYPYYSMRDGRLVNLLKFIFSSMNSNSNFSGIDGQIAGFGTAATAFSKLVTKAKNRDRNVIVTKNAARTKAIAMVLPVSNSVQQQSAGAMTMLISSGLPLRKVAKTRVVAAPSVTIVTFDNTQGQLMIKAKGAKGARGYIFKYAQSPLTDASNWQSISCSLSKCTITGLITGAKYYIQVGIMAAKGVNVFGTMVLSPFVP
jgi:hypothetical protein